MAARDMAPAVDQYCECEPDGIGVACEANRRDQKEGPERFSNVVIHGISVRP